VTADHAGQTGSEREWDLAYRFGLSYFTGRLDRGLLNRTDISEMLINAYELGRKHGPVPVAGQAAPLGAALGVVTVGQAAREAAVEAVLTERARQDAKWGQQNHPDGTGEHWEALTGRHAGAAAEMAEDAQRRTDEAAERGECTWSLILAEEFAEAVAEQDPAKLRTELVQVAAVALQWVEAIDRRAALTAAGGQET
jgi:hypothetical protein